MSANPPTVPSSVLSELAEQRQGGLPAQGVPIEPLKPIIIAPLIPPSVVESAAERYFAAAQVWARSSADYGRHSEKVSVAKQGANVLSRELGELESFLAAQAPERLAALKKELRAFETPTEFPEIQ